MNARREPSDRLDSRGDTRSALGLAAGLWLGTAAWFATREVAGSDSSYTVLRRGDWSHGETVASTMDLRSFIAVVLLLVGLVALYRCLRQPSDRLPNRAFHWLVAAVATCAVVVFVDMIVRLA